MGVLLIPVFAIGVWAGTAVANMTNSTDLENCAKEHNVYECEIKYVPKDKSDD